MRNVVAPVHKHIKSDMLNDNFRTLECTLGKSGDKQKVEEHTEQRTNITGSAGKTGRTSIANKTAVY